jgi:hypothetical protein
MQSGTSKARAREQRMLLALLALGFLVRLAAAFAVQSFAVSRQKLCVFPDTDVYWRLGEAITNGLPFAVSQWGVPHFAIRTPGYPLFLAATQVIFGSSSLLPVRIVQAFLGAICALLEFALVLRVYPDRRVALCAAALTSVEPYTVGMSALVLSEALFIPLMLLSLLGTAALWAAPNRPTDESHQSDAAQTDPRNEGDARRGRTILIALGTGVAHGAAILVRPSWALAVPLLSVAWWLAADRRHRAHVVQASAIVALGVALVMSPWWVRNARVFGRFVPTAVWVGASLYDGLNASATGASDMRFLEAPDIKGLDEIRQDRVLRARAFAFVQTHPGRAARLAVIKLGRFFSPWPNADRLRAPGIAAASALVTIPLFAAIVLGAFRCRHDTRCLVLLLGPLVYFCCLHLIFVSSIRYRIPAEVPALGLAAFALIKRRS